MRPAHRQIVLALSVVLGVYVLSGAGRGFPADGHNSQSDPVLAQSGSSSVRVTPSDSYRFEPDLSKLQMSLNEAPTTSARRGPVAIALPAPDGDLERFAVASSTVMEPGLAAAHPDVVTYSGRSLDHPGTTIAMDITPMGLHASVRGPFGQSAWYIDPAYNRRGTTTHLSYYGSALPDDQVAGLAESATPEIDHAISQRARHPGAAPGALVKQRVYRLALTSDPSYAAYFGTENVTAEKVTLINRVNQIYNDDLGISLRLVDATDELNLDTQAKATGANGPCGAHPCFDAATSDADSQLAYCDGPALGRNRTVLGQLVGASNYDIGHLTLGVDGGGLAFVGVVGWDYKAGGCTGLPTPQGDYFAVDYVAHELGHQFSATHTFNGTEGSCAGGNRTAGASVEPGSGSSVMAYAGICGSDDLQPHTDPYFSQRTITQVSRYTSTPTQQVVEVQTVSLRGFDSNGESVTLDFPGAAEPVTLTRGTNYNADGIAAAVESLTGENVTIAQWGYDPFGDRSVYPAPIKPPNGTGFQVIFANSPKPDVGGTHADLPSLVVTSSDPGVSGFVGETAKGGPADNRGNQVVTTANHAPTVHAHQSRTIPLQTPFVLRGSGTDADGDPLVFLWEQNDPDLAAQGTALSSEIKTRGPLFRVFGHAAHVSASDALLTPSPGENRAGTTAARTFPDMQQVLDGNTNALTGRCHGGATSAGVSSRLRDCLSEFLPTRAYVGGPGRARPSLHFRLTARDDAPGGGGTGHDEVAIKLDRSAGPFLVTSQHAGTTEHRGSSVRVTWAVNGTKRLAHAVRIRLSLDAGKSWPVTLNKKTPNDGSAIVHIPENARTAHARLKIEAVGNYFFAVNDAEFRIR